jgi:hypothetical protein
MVNLQASLILEILGRPKENVSAALQTVIDRLGSEKGVKMINKTLHEPKPLEKTDLFTSFAEVDVELDSIMTYISVIFTHMPSNIEITHPENITLNNLQLNELGNALTQRLHHYDAIAKTLLAERDMFAQKLNQVAPHLFKKNEVPKEPPKEPEEIPKKKKKSKKN